MNLLNATKMQASYTMGLQPDGRELIVVVVKGTFLLPQRGEPVVLATTQDDFIHSDVFTAEPGFSAPLNESEFAPFKPKCDVLLNGSAYAPHGKPAKCVTVALRVGAMRKRFDVLGARRWKRGFFGLRASATAPFTVAPISYDHAYGGMDRSHPNPKKHTAYLANLAGRGYHPKAKSKQIRGTLLPHTQESGRNIRRVSGRYRPMSFGAIGRSWTPRLRLAGTYDQQWIDHVFPFLPPDFDNRYYQSAPPDQQIDYPRGGERVSLTNLTPQPIADFSLPSVDVPISFFYQDHTQKDLPANLDTILIEPDQRRLILVWRAALPLKKNLFEIHQMVAGRMPAAWYRARELGKRYYPSIAELIADKGRPVNAQ